MRINLAGKHLSDGKGAPLCDLLLIPRTGMVTSIHDAGYRYKTISGRLEAPLLVILKGVVGLGIRVSLKEIETYENVPIPLSVYKR